MVLGCVLQWPDLLVGRASGGPGCMTWLQSPNIRVFSAAQCSSSVPPLESLDCARKDVSGTAWQHESSPLAAFPSYTGWNVEGELGASNLSDTSFYGTPVQAVEGSTFSALSAGWSHTCGIETSGGATLCWGAPALRTGIAGCFLACIWFRTCCTFAAGASVQLLTAPRSLPLCPGHNAEAQLGTDLVANYSLWTHRHEPVEVVGNHTFRSISCGRDHTCALDEGGQAWCWGVSGGVAPHLHMPPYAGRAYRYAPGPNVLLFTVGKAVLFVAGGDGRRRSLPAADEQLAATTTRLLITLVLQGGSPGVLGNGLERRADQPVPVPVPVSGGLNFSVVQAGTFHTCALTLEGSMWCWGSETRNGQANYTTVPARVGGGHTFVALSAGYDQTCGLDASGSVWCFGACCWASAGCVRGSFEFAHACVDRCSHGSELWPEGTGPNMR